MTILTVTQQRLLILLTILWQLQLSLEPLAPILFSRV